MADSHNGVTVAVDSIDGVFADILAYFFGFSSPKSNLPLGVIAASFGKSHGNKFNCLFIFLLTLLQSLTKFLINRIVVQLAPSPGTIFASFWRKKSWLQP